jgi:GTPase SAR1 family protein
MKLIDNSDEFSDNDGYIIVYSVTDRQSFEIAIDILNNLVYFEKTESPIILVGNKSDLVRKRSISREGNLISLFRLNHSLI